MMGKRNRMIMFAVIASIIVAAPVSFYALLDPHTILRFQDVSSSGTITGNFSSPAYSNFRLNYSKESIVNETAYVYSANNTTLGSLYLSNLAFIGVSQFVGLEFSEAFLLEGNFSSSLHPSSVRISVNASAPGTPANVANYRLNLMSYIICERSFASPCKLNNISIPNQKFNAKQFSCTFSLQRPSPVKTGDEFHFGMFGSNGSRIGEGIILMVNSPGNMVRNLTVTYSIAVIISGQSQPLEDTVTTYLVDTGVKY